MQRSIISNPIASNPIVVPERITLTVGAYVLELAPTLGGAITGFWAGDAPILRPLAPGANDVRLVGCYPLLPYAGRLAWCRFDWRNQACTTRQNFGDHPHSLHGTGWQSSWKLERQSPDSACMTLLHRGDENWPFDFRAQQDFYLRKDGLEVHLRYDNIDSREQPVGLGWHPYFPRHADSHIETEVQHCWENDAQMLPVKRVPQSSISSKVHALKHDHCFDGWSGRAILSGGRHRLTLLSDLDYLVVFTPPHKDFFCVEPVSHRSDAIHAEQPLAHGLHALAPGQSLSARMQIIVQCESARAA